ncbi:MAG: hypothetical protein KR126chlam1_00551 [Chlamydiae bacterium]|nr:hypothetical protein [Chlamydiota bacterium]
MSQRKKSKEELYLLKLFKLSKSSAMDRYKLGNALGYHTKSVDTIVQTLTKNNFLKKDGDEVYLTELGLSLARSLLHD